jgi:hypothetical protein
LMVIIKIKGKKNNMLADIQKIIVGD